MNIKKRKKRNDERYYYLQNKLDREFKKTDNPKYKCMKNLCTLQKNITEIGFSLEELNKEEYEEFSENLEYLNKLIGNFFKKYNIKIEGFEE